MKKDSSPAAKAAYDAEYKGKSRKPNKKRFFIKMAAANAAKAFTTKTSK